jgi:hypothetical protein
VVSFALRPFIPQERAASTPGIEGRSVFQSSSASFEINIHFLSLSGSEQTSLGPPVRSLGTIPTTQFRIYFFLHYLAHLTPKRKRKTVNPKCKLTLLQPCFFTSYIRILLGGSSKFSRVCKSCVYRFKLVNAILDIYSTMHNKILSLQFKINRMWYAL